VRERRAEFEAQRQISDDVIEMMKAVGIYRALVARRFGGDEMPPGDFLRLIETISQADGSAGWVASFGVSAIYLSALPVATLESIYAKGPDVVFAGGIFPPQKAVRVEGGLEVTGRWSWGSGCTGAALIGVGIQVEGGGATDRLPRMAVMPREKVRIVRNWDVNGLKGTGSHDMAVDKVVVPESWTFLRGGPSSLDTPLFRYPPLALAAQVLAVVGLGVARAALDEIVAIAGDRPSITGAPPLAERPYLQAEIARAEAELRSARAFFYEATEQAFATLLAGDPLDLQRRALLRLSGEPRRAGRRGRRPDGLPGLWHDRHLHRPPDRPALPGRARRPAAHVPSGGHLAECRTHPARLRGHAGLSLNGAPHADARELEILATMTTAAVMQAQGIDLQRLPYETFA
jgi:indole-3-acetate monooxygenase